jgi:WD40 repeat protein
LLLNATTLHVTRAKVRGTASVGLGEIRTQRLPAPVLDLDLSPSGSVMLCAARLADGRVLVWRIETGEILHHYAFPAPDSELRQRDEIEPIHVRFSPDGTTLAVSYLSRIHVFDTTGWGEIASLGVQGEDAVRPRPRPALRRRADDEERQTPQQMGQDFEKRMARGDGATRITDFAFTPDGSAVLAAYCGGGYYDYPGFSVAWGSGKDPVRLWALPSGRLLWERVWDPDSVVRRVTPSPDGKRFAVVIQRKREGTLAMCDLASGQWSYPLALQRLALFRGVPPLFFTAEGRYLVAGLPGHYKRPPIPGAFIEFDPSDGRRVAELPRQADFGDADISSDGRWLVTSTLRGMKILMWDVAARKVVLRKLPSWRATITKVRFDPSGRFVVAVDGGKGLAFVYAFHSGQ